MDSNKFNGARFKSIIDPCFQFVLIHVDIIVLLEGENWESVACNIEPRFAIFVALRVVAIRVPLGKAVTGEFGIDNIHGFEKTCRTVEEIVDIKMVDSLYEEYNAKLIIENFQMRNDCELASNKL